MKLGIKHAVVFGFLCSGPFAFAEETTQRDDNATVTSKQSLAKKSRHRTDSLPVKNLLSFVESTRTSTPNEWAVTNIEASTLHLPALNQPE